MNRLDDLIEKGKRFNFDNNSERSNYSGDVYGKASDELLGWAAAVEDFILNSYGQQSAPYRLYQTFNRDKLNGYYKGDFDEQLTILNGALKACKNIPIQKRRNPDDHPVVRLIKNPLFWTVLVVAVGAAYAVGLNFGSARFDREKLELYEQTIELNKSLTDVNAALTIKDSIILELNKINSELRDSLKLVKPTE